MLIGSVFSLLGEVTVNSYILRAKKTRHVTLPSKMSATSTRDKNEAEGSTTTAMSVTIVKRVSLCDTKIRVVTQRSELITSRNLIYSIYFVILKNQA